MLHSDLMLLLARTTPLDELRRKTRRASRVFLVDMRAARRPRSKIRPIDTMINHATTELFFDDVEVPADALIGEEGMGFRYILDGMNAERILIAAECVGDGRWFVERAARYASERVGLRQADRRRTRACSSRSPRPTRTSRRPTWCATRRARLFDARRALRRRGEHGEAARVGGLLGGGQRLPDTHGGYGFAAEYDVERKFRETRLYSVAPVNNNLVLAYLGQHVLGMPKSY